MESEEYYNNISNIVKSTKDCNGDIIELGVYKGKNSIIIGGKH